MSILRVRVNKYLESEGGPPPEVFARITQVDERGRTVPESLRHDLVPISTHDDQTQALTLGAGAYVVEVRLPTGELLTDSVHLPEGGEKVLVLTAESSPHEWLSWQHLAGNVSISQATITAAPPIGARAARERSTQKARKRALARRSTGPARPATMTDVMRNLGLRVADGEIRAMAEPGEVATWAPTEPASLDVSQPIVWLGRGMGSQALDFLRQVPWQSLPLLRGDSENLVEGLRGGHVARVIEPVVSDSGAAVFRVPNEPETNGAAYSAAGRDFAAVQRRSGVELVCVPTPWVETWSGNLASIEIGVQLPRYEAEFASSVVVRDHQLAVLLGFLSSGALTAVKRLAETASGLLFEKSENPLAAAAGGYALVGTAVDTSPRPWHAWIENLMNRYEHLPDGAIQYATMRLRLRTGDDDLREATRAFKLAYQRGLPFYGLGMRWLLDGLERVGSHDYEAQEMATTVRRLASRLHPQSPFTILRLGKR